MGGCGDNPGVADEAAAEAAAVADGIGRGDGVVVFAIGQGDGFAAALDLADLLAIHHENVGGAFIGAPAEGHFRFVLAGLFEGGGVEGDFRRGAVIVEGGAEHPVGGVAVAIHCAHAPHPVAIHIEVEADGGNAQVVVNRVVGIAGIFAGQLVGDAVLIVDLTPGEVGLSPLVFQPHTQVGGSGNIAGIADKAAALAAGVAGGIRRGERVAVVAIPQREAARCTCSGAGVDEAAIQHQGESGALIRGPGEGDRRLARGDLLQGGTAETEHGSGDVVGEHAAQDPLPHIARAHQRTDIPVVVAAGGEVERQAFLFAVEGLEILRTRQFVGKLVADTGPAAGIPAEDGGSTLLRGTQRADGRGIEARLPHTQQDIVAAEVVGARGIIREVVAPQSLIITDVDAHDLVRIVVRVCDEEGAEITSAVALHPPEGDGVALFQVLSVFVLGDAQPHHAATFKHGGEFLRLSHTARALHVNIITGLTGTAAAVELAVKGTGVCARVVRTVVLIRHGRIPGKPPPAAIMRVATTVVPVGLNEVKNVVLARQHIVAEVVRHPVVVLPPCNHVAGSTGPAEIIISIFRPGLFSIVITGYNLVILNGEPPSPGIGESAGGIAGCRHVQFTLLPHGKSVATGR